MISADRLSALIRQLTDEDAVSRRAAAAELAAADERALYPLIKALRDEHPGVQDAAMRSLISIGGETAAYLTLPLLREDAYLRNTARIILKQIGTAAVPLLRPLLRDKDDDIRIFAADLITDIGVCSYPEELTALLRTDPNPNARSAAARALGRIGHRPAVPDLLKALQDEEWVVVAVVEALSELRDAGSAEAIAELLITDSEVVRCAAIETLGAIASPTASDALLARFPSASDATEKQLILKSLIRAGVPPPFEETEQLLIELYRAGAWEDKLLALRGIRSLTSHESLRTIIDEAGALDATEPGNEERLAEVRNALVRFGCSQGLLSIVADPAIRYRGRVLAIEALAALRCKTAAPQLIALLEGAVRDVRRACAEAIADMSPESVCGALQDCIEDHDGHVRRAAIQAIGRIGDPASFQELYRHLGRERYADVLEETVRALVAVSEEELRKRLPELAAPVRAVVAKTAKAVATLLALSEDADRSVRMAAFAGLGDAGTDEALLRLRQSLGDADPEVRSAAVSALGGAGQRYEEIRPLLADPDPWVRLAALHALARSGRRELAADVIPLASDMHPTVVHAAIDVLGEMGGDEAVAAIAGLKDHRDDAVRSHAAETLERMT